jgi:recombination protein RecT
MTKAIVSISNHFAIPKVNDFLSQQLGKKKGEFVSNVIALSESNADLQKCDPGSLMKCAMNATALNLPLNKNLGYAYVIPYNNKKKGIVEPQFQIGYKGFIQLAIRSGQYKTINAVEVREGEIKRNKFTGEIEFLKENDAGKVVGYLGYIKMLNGFEQSFYMTVDQAEAHAKKYSQNYAKWGTGLWKDDFDAMAKKTVLKLLLNRYGILSTEIQRAIETDQQIDGVYADNPGSGPRTIEDTNVIDQPEPTVEATPKSVDIDKI